MNTRKTVVLTGGRAPATLELARLMDQAGHRVVMVESARYHLCKASRAVSCSYQVPPPRHQPDKYIQALKQIMEQEKADLLIPTCEEIFYVSRGLERLVTAGRVLAEGIDVLRPLHDKWRFGQLASNAGATVPSTKLAESDEQMREALKHASGPVVLKPVFSRFAAHVCIVHDPASAASGNLPAISKQQPWLVQEFIKGRQLCSYAVAHQGQLALYADYETTYTAGQGASIHFSYANHQGVREFVSRFVDLQQFTGQIAFDFIEDRAGQLYVIECNPRLTSGIHLFADQMQVAEAFFGKKCEVFVPRGNQAFMLGMAMLAYGLPAVRNVAEGRRWLRDYHDSRDVLWRNSDPLPYFQQLRMLTDLAKQGLQTGKSMMECSTSDIEWNGEE